MKDRLPTLAELQRWMQGVITTPGAMLLDSADTGSRPLESVVTASRSLSAADRLAIYSRSYWARLLESLKAEYPALLHALGEPLFESFSLDFLQTHPPGSYSLQRLAEGFPAHLAATRPDRRSPGSQREAWIDFLVDLATVERAFAEVYDGPGTEGEALLSASALERLDPTARTQLRPAPCLRLLKFRFPVHDYCQAVRAGENPDLPMPAETHLALSRRRWVVGFHPLTGEDWRLLSATVDEACLAHAAKVAGLDEAKALRRIRDFCAAGFFLA